MNRLPIRLTLLALAAALIALGPGCSSSARKERYARSANEYFARRQYPQAIVQYLNALRLDPKNPALIRNLGLSYLRSGDPRKAFPLLAKANELAPDDTETQVALGAINLLAGRHAEARRLGSSVLAREPKNFDALAIVADTSFSPEDLADAEQRLGPLKDAFSDSAPFQILCGNVSLRQRKVEEAGKAYEAAIAIAPGTSFVYQAMASYHRATGDMDAADRDYQKAAELAPTNSPARLAWAVFKAESGRPEEARRILEEVTRAAPNSMPAWFELAKLAYSSGQHEEAQTILERVLKAQPNHFEGRLLLGRVKLSRGATADAIRDYEALLAEYSNSSLTRYCLAQAYLKAGQQDKAMEALRRAVEFKPDFVEAGLLLAGLDLREGHAAAVVAYMEPLLKKHPGVDPAHVLLGAAYRAQKRPDLAEPLYRELVRRKASDPQPHYLLGLSLREQGRKLEARAAFERSLDLGPAFVRPLTELVAMELSERQYGPALARLQKQAQTNPETPGIHYLIGRVCAAQGKPNEAEEAFTKAIEADPKFPGPYLALSHLYLAQDKLDEALAKIEQNLALHTNEVASLMLSATIRERQRDTARARELYEKILAVQPAFVPALNNLAFMLSEPGGDLNRAYDLATRARRVAATDPHVADTLGWILYHRKDYAWARSLLAESAEQLPANAEVLFHLGMTHYALGDERSALQSLQQALEKNSSFAGADQAQRLVAVLTLDPDAADGTAAATLRDVLARDPENTAALVRQARLDLNAGKTDAARRSYEKVLAANTNYVPALTGLAEILSRNPEERARALDYAKRARDLAPDDPRVTAVAATAAEQAGQRRWAASLLEESAKRLPKDPLILYRLGLANYALGAVDAARRQVQQAQELGLAGPDAEGGRRFLECLELTAAVAPTDADLSRARESLAAAPDSLAAQMAVARLERKLSQTAEALKRYEALVERYPEFAPAARDLAALYAGDRARAEKAYKLATAARSAMPEDPECAGVLGRLAYERGDAKWAVQLLKQSTDAADADAEAFFFLGAAYQKLGEKENAARALRRALEIQPDFSHAEKARELLSALP